MPKNDDSFRDRMRQVTLAHWGGMVMVGSGIVGAISNTLPSKNPAEQFGRGIGVMLGLGIGMVLVIVHFVRRGLSKTTDGSKRKPN